MLKKKIKKPRVPVRIPPGQVFESKKNPVSKAKRRRQEKKAIKEGLKDLN